MFWIRSRLKIKFREIEDIKKNAKILPQCEYMLACTVTQWLCPQNFCWTLWDWQRYLVTWSMRNFFNKQTMQLCGQDVGHNIYSKEWASFRFAWQHFKIVSLSFVIWVRAKLWTDASTPCTLLERKINDHISTLDSITLL